MANQPVRQFTVKWHTRGQLQVFAVNCLLPATPEAIVTAFRKELDGQGQERIVNVDQSTLRKCGIFAVSLAESLLEMNEVSHLYIKPRMVEVALNSHFGLLDINSRIQRRIQLYCLEFH